MIRGSASTAKQAMHESKTQAMQRLKIQSFLVASVPTASVKISPCRSAVACVKGVAASFVAMSALLPDASETSPLPAFLPNWVAATLDVPSMGCDEEVTLNKVVSSLQGRRSSAPVNTPSAPSAECVLVERM
eukprot:scaffold204861_cov34-Tisochrysis_lutea.AAC.8